MIFDKQPEVCRQKIDVSNINLSKYQPHIKRLFQCDPSIFYERIEKHGGFDIYKRQYTISMIVLFPKTEGICGCGCGKQLTGRRTRWYSKNCAKFATSVFYILSGYASNLRVYRKMIVGAVKCENCASTKSVELDHIHPVKYGGGGGWLNNYIFLCQLCHRDKTNKDFGFKQYKKTNNDN